MVFIVHGHANKSGRYKTAFTFSLVLINAFFAHYRSEASRFFTVIVDGTAAFPWGRLWRRPDK